MFLLKESVIVLDIVRGSRAYDRPMDQHAKESCRVFEVRGACFEVMAAGLSHKRLPRERRKIRFVELERKNSLLRIVLETWQEFSGGIARAFILRIIFGGSCYAEIIVHGANGFRSGKIVDVERRAV